MCAPAAEPKRSSLDSQTTESNQVSLISYSVHLSQANTFNVTQNSTKLISFSVATAPDLDSWTKMAETFDNLTDHVSIFWPVHFVLRSFAFLM